MKDQISTPAPALDKTVLVLFAEPTIRDLLATNFRSAGYYPVAASSLQEGRRLTREVCPDVILMDMDSPTTGDASFVSSVAECATCTDVLTVMVGSDLGTACGPDQDRCGTALCFAKPFSPRALVGAVAKRMLPKPFRGVLDTSGARQFLPAVRSVQPTPSPRESLRLGHVELSYDEHGARIHKCDGSSVLVHLRPAELRVLQCLIEGAGRFWSREELLKMAYGTRSGVSLRTIDQNVRRIRARLAIANAADVVVTLRGLGYRIDVTNQFCDSPPAAS